MCELCEQAKNAAGGDEDVAIVILPATAPAARIIARHHAPLNEQAPPVAQKMLEIANATSTLIFEQLGAHGTNIILEDGTHASYVVAGRTENDGIDLRWKPERASKEELESAAKRISEEAWYIGKKDAKKIVVKHDISPHARSASPDDNEDDDPTTESPTELANKMQHKRTKGISDENNYLIRQLTRRR